MESNKTRASLAENTGSKPPFPRRKSLFPGGKGLPLAEQERTVPTALPGTAATRDPRASNCSVKPWKNGRSASSPQRSSHIASVSPLSHQRSGWTTPRTGQPRVLASRETPLHGWRTDHIVPTPRVSSPLSAPSPDGGGRGTLRRLLGRHRGQTRRRSSPRLDRTVTRARFVESEFEPVRRQHLASMLYVSLHVFDDSLFGSLQRLPFPVCGDWLIPRPDRPILRLVRPQHRERVLARHLPWLDLSPKPDSWKPQQPSANRSGPSKGFLAPEGGGTRRRLLCLPRLRTANFIAPAFDFPGTPGRPTHRTQPCWVSMDFFRSGSCSRNVAWLDPPFLH